MGIAVAAAGAARADEVHVQGKVEGAKQPQVAVAKDGRVAVAFGAGNAVYCATSADGGKTFGAPVKVGGAGALALGMRRGPRVAATARSICVAAICGEKGKGQDGDVFAWRSQDGGKTWSKAARVNDEKDSAREGLHALAAGPDDETACAWIDMRRGPGAAELEASISKDGGATWGKNALVYASPDGTVCECCHPAIAFDAKGGLLALFRNWLEGSRDMYVVRSRDGRTFGKLARLGSETWRLKACPMAGGAVAAAPDGGACAVWSRAGSIYLTTPKESERLLGEGRDPWLAAGPGGPHAVWCTRGGEVHALTPASAGKPTRIAFAGTFPVVAAAPDGSGPVVAAWEGADGAIVVRVLAAKH